MDLKKLILEEFPYPVSVNYHQLLEIQGWEARTRKCIQIFEFGLRSITLFILSQYLIDDVADVFNSNLDRLLHRKLGRAALGDWVEFFFQCLYAYQGKRNRLFIPELYDLYWDKNYDPNRKRKGVQTPYTRLVQIRNDLSHSLPPNDEAGWKLVGEEALQCLNNILEQFEFLKDYDLIRIISENNGEYEYECFTGLLITNKIGKLLSDMEYIREGRLYLKRGDKQVLSLYPLMIFWLEKFEQVSANESKDAAIFNRLTPQSIEYIATVIHKVITDQDDELLAMFRELIFYNLEHIKLAVKKTTFSWAGLSSAMKALTIEYLKSIGDKYNPNIYFQRESTLNEFRKFLYSDKKCFVLTGKSGVGKTNFIASLVDEFVADDSVGLIIYNAGHFSSSESVLNKIQKDLVRYVDWQQPTIDQFLAEMEKREILEGKTLVIIFDAINENADSKSFLKQIDHVASEGGRSWLKFMITSRPETWKRLSMSTPLADGRYYHSENTLDSLEGIESNLSVELLPFDEKEIEPVFNRYRQQYRINNNFNDLRPSIIKALRDPLVMRLIVETNAGDFIPQDIRESQIYDMYLDRLLKTRRLNEEDIIFLKHDLVPLMLNYDHLDNKITVDQIQYTQTGTGKPLWELIFNDGLLTDGKRVNASFIRLVDAEILIGVGTVLNYEIYFKFERFFDYFGGAQLHELYLKRSDAKEFFLKVFESAKRKPFLIGCIKQTLTRILTQGEIHLIMDLCAENSLFIRSVLVAVLEEYSETNIDLVNSIIEKILPTYDKNAITSSNLPSGLLAVQVGGRLSNQQVLASGIRSPIDPIRMLASRQVFLLWCRDHALGWKILEDLIQDIQQEVKYSRLVRNILSGRIHLHLLESAGWVSLYILLNYHQETNVTSQLRSIWRPVISKLLRFGKKRSYTEFLFGWVREQILSALIEVIVYRLKAFPARYNPASIAEFYHYFTLQKDIRDLVVQLAEYMDPEYGNEAEMSRLIMTVYPTQDGIVNQIIGHVLLSRCLRNFPKTLPIVQDVFDLSLKSDRPGIISGNMQWVMVMLLLIGDPTNEQAFEVLHKMLITGAEKVKEWYSPLRSYAHVWFDDYARVYVNKFGSSKVDLLDWYVSRNFENQNWAALEDFLYVIGRLSDSPYWRVVLEEIKLLKFAQEPKIQEKTVNILIRIRARHKEYLDEYLAEHFFDSNIRHLVMNQQVEENIFESLGGGSGLWVEFVNRFIHSDNMKGDLIWIASTIANSKSLAFASKNLVKWGINRVYGEEIFNLKREK